MKDDTSRQTESSSSSSEEEDILLEMFNRRQMEELILHKITHELDASYLPGILGVLKHVEEDEEEVEIDLGQLKKDELESILVYVEACLHKEQTKGQCSKKKSDNKKKKRKRSKGKKVKRKPVHRRRLLEDMLHPSDDSGSNSSGEENGIVIFHKSVTVIKNQTIVHETSQQRQEPIFYEPGQNLEEDEVIDIML
ncbi:unnamed protein product [Rhizopus stolonifer]